MIPLTITYSNGHMIIDLAQFIKLSNLSDWKKLIRLFSVENARDVREFMLKQINYYNGELLPMEANHIYRAEMIREYNNYKKQRDKYRRRLEELEKLFG